MLPTKRTDAFTPQSIADYQTLATENASLPPALEDFLALLGPEGKGRHDERRAALAAVIQDLQAGHPVSASIQLWLLVTYNPPLHNLVGRYASPHSDTESMVVLAFLEVLQTMSAERLADAYLEKRIVDDARRRLMVLLGIRDYQQADRLELVDDEAVQDDRVPDEHVDGYEALLARINELPITDAERDLLVGIYVYGYNMSELAEQLGVTPQAVKQRVDRLTVRLQKIIR